MDKVTSIISFGSLTVNGKKLSFKDFDKNNDGQISESEYKEVLKTVQSDSVEFSTVDTNEDKSISQKEFLIWEQKTLMQDAVNNLANQIGIDFSGKSEYLEELTDALKTLINDYAKTYCGDITKIAENFEKELPEKYEEIKNSILSKDASTISARVIYEISEELSKNSYNGTTLRSDIISKILTDLNGAATRFVSKYKGSNFEKDLKDYLQEYLNSSESDLMSDSLKKYETAIAGFSATSDIKEVKEVVKELLISAIDNGIILQLGGYKIYTEAAITCALCTYTDVESLLQDVVSSLTKLNSTKKMDAYVQESQLRDETEKEAIFKSAKGYDYQINTTLIDYTKLDSRYFDEGTIYHKERKSKSKQSAYDEGFALLTDDALKSQVKSQILAMLQEKGIPFERIEKVFENVYNQSAQDTLNEEGMITGRHRTWFKKQVGEINVKTMYDTFLSKFNANIASAIDTMNASDKDIDLIDLDYDVLDNNGVAQNGEDFSALYASGNDVTVEGKGSDYYIDIASKLVDNMKSQILTKAQNMCKANGVEFDNSVFETMFNNAKNKAVSAAVTGKGKHGVRSEAGTVTAASVGAAAGGTLGAVVAGQITVLNIANAILGAGVASFCVPVVGWVAGAVLIVSAACLAIFGRKNPSSSTLNTKTLIDTFTQSFVDDFSQWVREGGKIAPKVETEVQTGTSGTESGETNKNEDEKKETEET